MSANHIDKILAKLLEVREIDSFVDMGEMEIILLCMTARGVFLKQPMLLELSPPLNICGDLHGQYEDLLRIFDTCQLPPKANYLFLGDYVDRGKRSIETICLLFAFKIKYPETFFLLRGNHESDTISESFGFKEECEQRYSITMWHCFTQCFDCMPVAAIIADQIFCCHGGLSPNLKSLDDIRQIQRPAKMRGDNVMNDLLWADPDEYTDSWDVNDRGTSFTFGTKIVDEFLSKFNFTLICRAHEAVNGYKFFANRGLVTVFSASNYCGEQGNLGAVLVVDKEMKCSFIKFKPILTLQTCNDEPSLSSITAISHF